RLACCSPCPSPGWGRGTKRAVSSRRTRRPRGASGVSYRSVRLHNYSRGRRPRPATQIDPGYRGPASQRPTTDGGDSTRSRNTPGRRLPVAAEDVPVVGLDRAGPGGQRDAGRDHPHGPIPEPDLNAAGPRALEHARVAVGGGGSELGDGGDPRVEEA